MAKASNSLVFHRRTHIKIRDSLKVPRGLMTCNETGILMAGAEVLSILEQIPPGELKRLDEEYRKGLRPPDSVALSAVLIAAASPASCFHRM